MTQPTAMSSTQLAMLTKLHGMHGADFDSHYDSDQVSTHKDAVSLYQRYSNGGDNAKLKTWAGRSLRT